MNGWAWVRKVAPAVVGHMAAQRTSAVGDRVVGGAIPPPHLQQQPAGNTSPRHRQLGHSPARLSSRQQVVLNRPAAHALGVPPDCALGSEQA